MYLINSAQEFYKNKKQKPTEKFKKRKNQTEKKTDRAKTHSTTSYIK